MNKSNFYGFMLQFGSQCGIKIHINFYYKYLLYPMITDLNIRVFADIILIQLKVRIYGGSLFLKLFDFNKIHNRVSHRNNSQFKMF